MKKLTRLRWHRHHWSLWGKVIWEGSDYQISRCERCNAVRRRWV